MKYPKKIPYGYIVLVITLALLISLPRYAVEKIRATALTAIAPLYYGAGFLSKQFFSPSQQLNDDLAQLRAENKVLAAELIHAKELLENEIELRYYLSQLKEPLESLDHLIETRHINLKKFLSFTLQSIPARVTFRSPGTWSNSLWINIGTDDYPDVVKKNSPVLIGDSIIGVIDYPGKRQSRVRLITDSGLVPSVRAVRKEDGKVWHLAKGELHGSGDPLWRKKSQELQGIGFNYDFPDAEGPARDLRTGIPVGVEKGGIPMTLIQVDDLLVTTGMDGVFPPGLSVALVTGIKMMKEGDYSYTITALPTAEHLEDLSLVFVIPPYSEERE